MITQFVFIFSLHVSPVRVMHANRAGGKIGPKQKRRSNVLFAFEIAYKTHYILWGIFINWRIKVGSDNDRSIRTITDDDKCDRQGKRITGWRFHLVGILNGYRQKQNQQHDKNNRPRSKE